jgi:YVTN family beta-propeller protein
MSIKIDGSAFRAGGRPRSAVGEYAMKPHIFSFIGAFALAGLLGSAQSLAQNAYITNLGSNSVSVIDTATNTVTVTIPVGVGPYGVAVSQDGSKLYVTNETSDTVSVIDTATNTVIATIPVGTTPRGVAVPPAAARSMSRTSPAGGPPACR